MELIGLKKISHSILDIEFYKRSGHAVLACLSVLYLTIIYVVGINVNISIYADLTIMAGMLVILPRIKLNKEASSSRLARNLFGYTFLSLIIFIAIGDSHQFLKLPIDSKTEFFTIVSHICMVLFGASKVEISRNAIESVKDAFNFRSGYTKMMDNFLTSEHENEYEPEVKKITSSNVAAQQELNKKIEEMQTPSSAGNLLTSMQSYRGMCEVKGSLHNKDLIALAKKAGFSWYTKDEIPWCAVMLNIACMVAGIKGTNSAMAKSFLKWGKKIALREARKNLGNVIAVFHRGETSKDLEGHVTVVESISEDGKYIIGIGGNQSDCVKSQKFRIDDWRFIEFRTI